MAKEEHKKVVDGPNNQTLVTELLTKTMMANGTSSSKEAMGLDKTDGKQTVYRVDLISNENESSIVQDQDLTHSGEDIKTTIEKHMRVKEILRDLLQLTEG